jgi:uncharacterized protein (TIGR02996 family)
MSAFAPPLLGLLEACKDALDDPTPQMILADWLLDHDEEDRSEFVRLHCPTTAPRQQVRPSRQPEQVRRRAELLRQHQEDWLAPFRKLPGEWSFHQGWIWGEMDVERLPMLPEDVLACPAVNSWVVGLRRTGSPTADWPRLLRLPVLRWFPQLALGMNWIGDKGVAALAESPHLTRLAALGLACSAIGNDGARALAASPVLTQLRRLNLAWNRIGDEGALALALAAAPNLGQLVSLNLRANTVSATATRVLQRRFGPAAAV